MRTAEMAGDGRRDLEFTGSFHRSVPWKLTECLVCKPSTSRRLPSLTPVVETRFLGRAPFAFSLSHGLRPAYVSDRRQRQPEHSDARRWPCFHQWTRLRKRIPKSLLRRLPSPATSVPAARTARGPGGKKAARCRRGRSTQHDDAVSPGTLQRIGHCFPAKEQVIQAGSWR